VSKLSQATISLFVEIINMLHSVCSCCCYYYYYYYYICLPRGLAPVNLFACYTTV